MTRNRPTLHSAPTIDEETVKADEPIRSNSASPSFASLLDARVSRRSTLRGGLGLAAVTIFAGAGLAGCSDDDDNNVDTDTEGGESNQALSFTSVDGSLADQVVVPDGYSVDTLLAWGTPIVAGAAAFDPATNTAADQAGQTGSHHDGMYLFPDDSTTGAGTLVVNHENISRNFMFPNGRSEDGNGRPTDPEQIRREMAAHGISVVRIERDSDGGWSHRMSPMNRRITAMTPVTMSGPAAGSELLVTPYSKAGTATRGTVNNCGRGFTPWGTYLSGEENIQGYFTTTDTSEQLSRYGITGTGFGFFWSAVSDNASDEDNGEFARFNVTADGTNATQDWRNEVNTFGWVVEVDPGNPSANPVKRTAMGRFRHEGVEPSVIEDGRPIAFYMGDDARGEYCYKFVTAENYDTANPDSSMLDRGTLYVARFNEDGSGDWLPLDVEDNDDLAQRFNGRQSDLLVYTRIAADIVGATPMDRPEWSAVDPNNGDIYYTLTNNNDRGAAGEEAVNAANPRPDNEYGHIIRQVEAGGDPAATTFTWDIFVFGAPAGDSEINRSGLTADNQFGGPDGLWFDRRGVLWIQTDNSGNAVADVTNDQMLAVIPASLAGKRTITPETQASLKRFLVGPSGCEITGSDLSADAKTLFANVQHPGGGFPDYDPSIPPRSATLAIRRDDDGEIAL